MISIRMPFWLRLVSLLGVILICTAARLYGYRWYNRPVTLTMAVGSIDGEAASAMSAIASQPHRGAVGGKLTGNRRHCAGRFSVDRADRHRQRYRTIVPTICI